MPVSTVPKQKASQCWGPAATPVQRRQEEWQPSTRAGASPSTIENSPENSGIVNVSCEDTGARASRDFAAIVQVSWSFVVQ